MIGTGRWCLLLRATDAGWGWGTLRYHWHVIHYITEMQGFADRGSLLSIGITYATETHRFIVGFCSPGFV